MWERARENCQRLTLAKIKEFDIVDYLLELGFKPVNIRNVDHWYLSPFRNERTASFKVNRHLNRWYDHGIGLGGNLVDFAVMYYQCSVREVFKVFADYLSFHRPTRLTHPKSSTKRRRIIEIMSTGVITSPSLRRYIASRSIPEDIAATYCRQIYYKVRNRQYFALGMKNDSGGYELRNSFAKVASSPKDIISIKNGASLVCVFEWTTFACTGKPGDKDVPAWPANNLNDRPLMRIARKCEIIDDCYGGELAI